MEKTNPEERVIVVSPTNLAKSHLAHECAEAMHRFGANPIQDFDILLLESKYATLSASENETTVIKQVQATDDFVEK